MTQKLIKFGSDFHYAGRGLLLYNEVCDFVAVGFPVWFCNCYRAGEVRSVGEGRRQIPPVQIRALYIVGESTHDCILRASNTKIALRRLPPESPMIS
jgi:hypothetical protein